MGHDRKYSAGDPDTILTSMGALTSTAAWVATTTGASIYSGTIEVGRKPILSFDPNDFLVTSDPTNNRNVSGGAGGRHGWSVRLHKTIFDLDFTAQPFQLLSTNGNHTVGGVTVVKENSNNDGTLTTRIIPGTGACFDPQAGCDYNFGSTYQTTSGSRSCPLLRIPFSQFAVLANMSWQTKLRLYVSLAANNNPLTKVFAAFDSGVTPAFSPGGAIMLAAYQGTASDNTSPSVGVQLAVHRRRAASQSELDMFTTVPGLHHGLNAAGARPGRRAGRRSTPSRGRSPRRPSKHTAPSAASMCRPMRSVQ